MPPTKPDTESDIRTALAADLEADGEPALQILGYTAVVRAVDLESGDLSYFRVTDQENDLVAELGLSDWGQTSIRRDLQRSFIENDRL